MKKIFMVNTNSIESPGEGQEDSNSMASLDGSNNFTFQGQKCTRGAIKSMKRYCF